MMLATSSVLLGGFFLLCDSSAIAAATVPSSPHVVRIGALFEEDYVDGYAEVLHRAVQDINNSNSSVRLEQPIVLAASSNPADILSQVCNQLVVRNVSAIIAVASETSLFTLSMAGDILGLPIIGIGSRSFAFSNKDVHPMYLRLESSESFQSYAIKRLLQRNGWFQFNVLASDHVDSQAFVQYLTNITTSSRKWNIQNTVVFSKDVRDVHRMLENIMETQTRVFVLHATPEYAAMLFEEARDYGLLEIGNVWIVTESVITNNPRYLHHYPTGLLAVNYVNDSDVVTLKVVDAVELLARASTKFATNFQVESTRNCWLSSSKQTIEYGRIYYSSLLSVPFQGQGGFICLDQEGNLNNASYEILNLIEREHGEERGFYWKKVGMWKNSDFYLESIIYPGNTPNLPHGLNTEEILIVINEEKPFIFESPPLDETFECLTGVLCLSVQSSQREEIEKAFEAYEAPTIHGNYSHMKRCCSGLAVDLLEKLSADVEFSYHLYLVADLNHGALENGRWNGMVGDLLRGTADVAVSSFSITSERSRVIDFTSPFFHSGFSTLVAKKQVEPQLDSFLAPLEWTVWILVFVTVNFVAIAITVFEWLSPYGLHPGGRNRHYTFGLPSALNIAFSILFSHTVKSKPPKCMTSRFLLNVWGAFSFIFFASYTANLAAFMAGQTSHLQIDGINDEKLNRPGGKWDITIGTVTGSSIQGYLKRVHPSLAAHMDHYIQETTEEAMQNLKSGELDAFIYDSPVIEYRMANDPECRLINVGKNFGEEGYGIGLPKGSPLKETLSIFILEYETDGYLEELQQKWFGTLNCYKESNIKSSAGIGDHKVRLAHVAGLFLMLLMGFGIGFLILILEHLVYRYGVPRLHLHPERTRNWLVLSQRLHRAANSDDLMPCKANMQEVITMFKKGQFTKMFQREQLRRKSMLRKDSMYEVESTATFKDLIDAIAWEKRRSSGQHKNDLRTRDAKLKKYNEENEGIMMQDLDRPYGKNVPRRLSDIGSDSDTSYDNLQRFSPTGELVRFSPHGDAISQSLSDSLSNVDQLDNQLWNPRDHNSIVSFHSNGDQGNYDLLDPEYSSNNILDRDAKKKRAKVTGSEDRGRRDVVSFALANLPNRQNGRAKFATWTDDDADDDDYDLLDQDPGETHPMMMDENITSDTGSHVATSLYANSSLRPPHSSEHYYSPYSYDPYDPSFYDARSLSKAELILRWRLSQREMTKRLGKALTEKAKLEIKVSELEAQLDDR